MSVHGMQALSPMAGELKWRMVQVRDAKRKASTLGDFLSA
jgi:hypothetical protein